MDQEHAKNTGLRQRVWEIIFEADTPAGKAFDVTLLACILLSVAAVMLESVESIHSSYGVELLVAEWIFTILFTIEYILRLAVVRRPLRYATSFFGVVDLLSILPTYLLLFGVGAQSLLVIRSLRLLRTFRVFKLARYVGEASVLRQALAASRPKITVFLFAVASIVLIVGALLHIVEGSQGNEGFSSLPQSVYWAIVTMTTVGYGDATPESPLGKAIASVVMILGYGIIAVPTGIVSAELSRFRPTVTTRVCPSCHAEGHAPDASYCFRCGAEL